MYDFLRGMHMNDSTAKTCPQCGSTMLSTSDAEPISPKSGIAALLLCMFFGVFGVHRFYVGKIGTGILMLLTWGGLGIWAFIDLIFIACCEFKDKEGRPLIFTRHKQFPVKLVLGIIGAFVISVILWSILAYSFMFYTTTGLTHTVEEQLNALKTGDVEKAYIYMSHGFKQSVSLEQFKQYIAQHPELTNNTRAIFLSRKIENNEGTLYSKLELSNGLKTLVEYHLIKEKDEWKILEIQVSPTQLQEIGY